MSLTTRQFDVLRDLIFKELGLQFEDAKVEFLDRRAEKRMLALGLKKTDEYIFHLRFLDQQGAEMQQLANLITTNETYMFREFDQLQAFADHCLPPILEYKEKLGVRRLRIWSAGCSSGEEAYTLAIILREVMHDADQWDIQILGTDIDQVRLEMASRKIYGKYAVRDVPDEYMARHMIPVADESYRVRPETARLVEFRHLNLSDRAAIRTIRDMDFIFCRNVLIYFSDASRKAAVENFYNSLNRGGYLYLGHCESLSRITALFQLKRLDKHLVYCKE